MNQRMRPLRAALFLSVTAALITMHLTSSHSAAGSTGDPATVVNPGCAGRASTDAAARPDGTIHGFTAFAGPACDRAIWFFEGSGNRWSASRSPYTGQVLAVADDGRDTFVLYELRGAVRVARRTQGRFMPVALLAASGGRAGDITA